MWLVLFPESIVYMIMDFYHLDYAAVSNAHIYRPNQKIFIFISSSSRLSTRCFIIMLLKQRILNWIYEHPIILNFIIVIQQKKYFKEITKLCSNTISIATCFYSYKFSRTRTKKLQCCISLIFKFFSCQFHSLSSKIADW